ncbi:helicase-related protein [Oceanibacterium hippocampi]|uniref:Helicase C-terminal domain-containing protein n=1 Tax=Oceanibacterium hippocampi TaxID=745714 RepID=A0A1Y5S4M0_9PROT|nr:helicase-related protein [Oceanibacterium hippocampi]SLN32484.1 hypothetical protein OCH7691_01207 [Oceanibacterium hippocampi]
MDSSQRVAGPGRIVALLGPTNTGKTHHAIERMLGHAEGVIGLPLRLLAREVYDRIVARRGPTQVALITGEEKIVPPRPAYFVCTVEAMPLDRDFDFVAIDEVQLAADPERGHVFTDRILHARGRQETMLLGADTIAPLLRRLVPDAEIQGRPRLSKLTYVGPKKLSRLPRRSAAVAFSAADVYAIAELLRRQKGGAAVVMGALSPRTRNAQVELFQSGEVDYIVATDAIGMGLNMDIDHVAFAHLSKFDGQRRRPLSPAEIGQIAGRAGRHLNDGSFGTTTDVGDLDEELVDILVNHQFEPLKQLYWRNTALSFATTRDLVRSLEVAPPQRFLIRPRWAEDHASLKSLLNDPAVRDIARRQNEIRLLWQVCQIPDFRKSMHEAHVTLLRRIYGHLTSGPAVLPGDWVAAQLDALRRTDGDIDTLATRIAHTRTWTYISHVREWTADPRHWQEKAREIEDTLSDALHQRLTHQFVDRRTTVLARQLRDKSEPPAVVNDAGSILVGGHYVGEIEGLAFRPDGTLGDPSARGVRRAAIAAAREALDARATLLTGEADDAFSLDLRGRIVWQEATIARLHAGAEALRPELRLADDELLGEPARRQLRERLQSWLGHRVETVLRPLARLAGSTLTGAARGLAFQLREGLGIVPRSDVIAQIRAFADSDYGRLRGAGIRLGRDYVFMPALLRPEATALRLTLWRIAGERTEIPAPPLPGRVSASAVGDWPDGFAGAVGFHRLGRMALRIDIHERLLGLLARAGHDGAFAPSPEMLALTGTDAEDFTAILKALRYRVLDDGRFEPPRERGKRQPSAKKRSGGASGNGKRPARRPSTRPARPRADSPFAELAVLQRGGDD